MQVASHVKRLAEGYEQSMKRAQKQREIVVQLIEHKRLYEFSTWYVECSCRGSV
jgi:hypothetical protein